jgi:hypothetical protein
MSQSSLTDCSELLRKQGPRLGLKTRGALKGKRVVGIDGTP